MAPWLTRRIAIAFGIANASASATASTNLLFPFRRLESTSAFWIQTLLRLFVPEYFCFRTPLPMKCLTVAILVLALASVAADPQVFQKLNAIGSKISHQMKSQSAQHASKPAGRKLMEETEPVLASKYGGTPGFYHGVASGSPGPDAVMIWTRWTPVAATETVNITYRLVAVDDDFDPIGLTTGQPHSLLASDDAKTGTMTAVPSQDWTVKVDVGGLTAKTTWIFRFEGPDGLRSRIGMTRTAPAVDDADVSEMNYAVFSCAWWERGFFHAYNTAASMEQLDFWIQLGDYIYEYGTDRVSDSGRAGPEWALDPQGELVSLNDYRARYALYHTDEALQNLRARAPLIVMWDDHEFVNDVWASGAENHQAGEGNFSTRVNGAAQAWVEWMPVRRGSFFSHTGVIRDLDVTQIVEWGQLATLAVFDTRVRVRTEAPADPLLSLMAAVQNFTDVDQYDQSPAREVFMQIAQDAAAARADASNEMMGDEQLTLLENTFRQSKADGKVWQLLATGTVFGKVRYPNVQDYTTLAGELSVLAEFILAGVLADSEAGGLARASIAGSMYGMSMNQDSWDGFVFERNRVLQMFKEDCNNPVVYSGDSHDSWAFAILEDEEAQSGDPVAVNIATPAVSSPGFGPSSPPLHELGFGSAGWTITHQLWEDANPSMKYANIKDKGFVKVRATTTEHTADYIFITDDLDSTSGNYDSFMQQAYGEFESRLAPHRCGARLTTTAAVKGSLVRSSCSDDNGQSTTPAPTETTTPTPEISSSVESAAGARSRVLAFGVLLVHLALAIASRSVR